MRWQLLGVLVALELAWVASGFGASVDQYAGAAPLVRNFSLEEMGATAEVNCLVESPEGVLFVGADCLLIYNGAFWKQVKAEGVSVINSLCFEGNRIWAGGVGEIGFFQKNHAGEWEYVSATARLNGPIGRVHRLYWNGIDIVVVSDRQVILLPPETGAAKAWELPSHGLLSSFQHGPIVYISQPIQGGRKGWTLVNRSLEPVPTELDQFSLRSHRGDRLIYNFKQDLFEYDPKSRATRIIYQDDGRLGATLPYVFTSIGDQVWIGTTKGVFVLNSDGSLREIGSQQGLDSDICRQVAPSRADGVWIGTKAGVSFVHALETAAVYSLGTPFRSVTPMRGEMWISTYGGDLHRLTAMAHEQFAQTAGTVVRAGSRVFVAHSGDLYVKDDSQREFSKWDAVTVTSTAGGSIVRDFRSSDFLYFSSRQAIARVNLVTGQKHVVDMPDLVGSWLQDAEGRVWISTDLKGVIAMDPELQKGTLHYPGRDAGALALHKGAAIVLGANGAFSASTGDFIANSQGIGEAAGTSSVDGPAWVRGRSVDGNAVGVVVQTEAGLALKRKNVPGLSSMKSFQSRPVILGNSLFLPSDSSVLQVDTTKLPDAELTLPEIETIAIRGKDAARTRRLHGKARELELASEENELAVVLKTRVWGLLEPPMFESRLVPAEDEWTLHKYGETITRKHIPTGQHTLQLRVRHLGELGPVSEYKVRHLPPWYFSYVGITMMAACVTLAFVGAVKLRTRQIERKNRELEEKIRERTQELAEANAAKSEFVAAMSHEIRNPMNGVVGIIKILQEAKLGAREKYYLTTLHRCAEQLRTTVDDVLDFSKIEAGEITLHPDTFDLSETISQTIAAVDISGDRVELTSWAGDRPMVRGDQGKLTQILTNYFTNALKYGVPARATVDVFVLNEGSERCRLTVAVKNAGPDIPAAELPTLFESFTRGEYARRRRIGGNGLGLSICKRYAEAMGGTVSATSSGGVTVFQLNVPFEVARPGEKPADAFERPKLHARALAIEDEDYNRLVLGSILDKLGYKVDWACDGKTALQLAESNGYDLILTDWMLPDTDGVTLTKRILADCEEPKPPVFAVTAYSTKEKELECRNAGMAGFISKPITVEKLEAALQQWAATRRGGANIAIETPAVQAEAPARENTSVSLQQLSRLGPIDFVLPDFIKKIQSDWAEIDHLLEDRQCSPAANAAHKLVSATLLVKADVVSDQLKLLERRLRDQAPDSEIEKVRLVCREEITNVARALDAALRRQKRPVNEAQSPT